MTQKPRMKKELQKKRSFPASFCYIYGRPRMWDVALDAEVMTTRHEYQTSMSKPGAFGQYKPGFYQNTSY